MKSEKILMIAAALVGLLAPFLALAISINEPPDPNYCQRRIAGGLLEVVPRAELPPDQPCQPL